MTESEIRSAVAKAVCDVRKTRPMAPSITNTVTVNFVANAQIACGGSAAMVYLPDEGETCAKIASSMYINMGTLFPVYEETLPRTARTLHELKKNWVLDPVALGIGSLRTKLVAGFKEVPPTIIRGNASEIIAVASLWNLDSGAGAKGATGVDSMDSVQSAENAAKKVAAFINGAVAVSGETDFVTDGTHSVYCSGGSHFMEEITGAGCSLGGVCAVYAAVASPFVAALTATLIYNLAGTRAEKKCTGPASFQTAFLDELYNASAEDVSSFNMELKS